MQAWLVQFPPQFTNHGGGLPERTQKCHLGSTPALGAHGTPRFQQRHIRRAIGQLVGDVKNHRIHSGVTQHLRMFAQDIRVIRRVIPENRFPPMMRGVQGPPPRAIRLLHRQRIILKDFPYIPWSACPGVRPQPQKIKQGDGPIRARPSGFGSHRQGAPQSVGRRPWYRRQATPDRHCRHHHQ